MGYAAYAILAEPQPTVQNAPPRLLLARRSAGRSTAFGMPPLTGPPCAHNVNRNRSTIAPGRRIESVDRALYVWLSGRKSLSAVRATRFSPSAR